MKVNLKFTAPLSSIVLLSSLAFAGTAFIDAPNAIISKPRQITFLGPKSGEGYFSADGKRMIFQSERFPGNPFYQMYLMDLETGKTNLVSTGNGKTTCGWIHPSLKKLMFSSTHLDPNSKKKQLEELEARKKPVKGRYAWSFDDQYDIFSADVDGKHLKRLTKDLGYDAEGSYSPDGKWIVFASNRAGYSEKLSSEDQKMFQQDPSYMMDIYLMKEDGSAVKRLTDAKGYDGGPFFSADGKKITWRRFSTNGATAEIFTMNADGSDQKPVTAMKSMSWAPYFHPSGDYIIYASSVLGFANFELFIIDTQGANTPVRVTFAEGFDGLPVFSPDGTQISWSHRTEKGESQIFIADWDDLAARRLLQLPPPELSVERLHPAVLADDARAIVSYLASEKMAGRRTGSAEERIYTEKIAELFKAFGLDGASPDGGYLQKFQFTSGVRLGAGNKLAFTGTFEKDLQIEKDYNVLSFSKTGPVPPAGIVFAGYGLKAPGSEKIPAFDSYKNIIAKDKWVLILKDTPPGMSPEVRQYLSTYASLQHKVTVARNEGAVGVLLVDSGDFSELKFEGTLSDSSLAVVKIQETLFKKLLKSAGRDDSLLTKIALGEAPEMIDFGHTYLAGEIALDFTKAEGINVIAKLPAVSAKKSHPRAPRLSVLISAHGDHLGRGEAGNSLAKADEKGQVHPGADDNASGVAGVLELAHYFSRARLPLKKDLLFAVWSGEEIGLLGSAAFVKAVDAKNKPDISQIIAENLNLDMIGRLDQKLFVQGVGSGDNWNKLTEEIAVKDKLSIAVQEDPYLPTDSMTLYLAKVPAINFFTGAHAEYHSPRDRAETLNYEGLERVTKTVGEYTRRLAETDAPLVKYVKVGGDPQKKLEGRTFRVYLGTIPDYTQEGVSGVRISGVSKGSPADLAGVNEKDIIVEFNHIKIDNLNGYVYALQSVPANVETTLKVLRNGTTKELKITPKLKE